jgi:hypothetical protein
MTSSAARRQKCIQSHLRELQLELGQLGLVQRGWSRMEPRWSLTKESQNSHEHTVLMITTLFALASLSARGASTPCGNDTAPEHASACGVADALVSPRLSLERGVERTGAQGEVRGLLLRAAAGAALDKIF